MVKINSTYHLMFCFIKGIDIHCGVLQNDKFHINEKFEECAFKTEDGQKAHLVIGQRTETKQTIFFEIVEEGKPRRIRKCVAPIKGGQSSVDPFKACDYADYDPVKEDPFNCIFRGKMNQLTDQQIITFDEKTWIINTQSAAFSNKAKTSVGVYNFNGYDYVLALDLDNVKIQTVIPRFFGVKLKDDGCGLEYFQAPSKEVFTSINFPSPCLPKTENNFYFFREQNLTSDAMDSVGNVSLYYLHACDFKPENHSMFCYIVGPKIYTIEYIDLGKKIENGNETFIEIVEENITTVSFSATQDVFYFMGMFKGFIDDGNGLKDNREARECNGLSSCKMTSWDVLSQKSRDFGERVFSSSRGWLAQFDCFYSYEIAKSKNRTFYVAKDLIDFNVALPSITHDYIFIDDYSGNKIYFPPKPKFFCFRVTFNLLMATLAMDGFLILLFGILFVLEIRGFRTKSYHDIRLELMLQKFAILKAAGRC
uniref:Uncharacterized protein n=1 Tax=Panagrolaimus sp. JU765 TaxID=591449 RepID=A0AC34RA24_9BILA